MNSNQNSEDSEISFNPSRALIHIKNSLRALSDDAKKKKTEGFRDID